MAGDLTYQRALAKRAVDDRTDAALACQRQDARLDLTVQHVVGRLHEIDPLTRYDPLDLAMAAAFRRRNADIAHVAVSLHPQQGRQMLLPGQKVMNLQQVEAWHAPPLARGLDLCGTACAGGNPYLVGREKQIRLAELAQAMADDILRRAVHGR